MSWPERIKRYTICLFGIFCISFGVALMTKGSLGTSAISVIPYTIALLVPNISYGMWVALFNMALALAQVFILRREASIFDIVQQLVFASIFGSIVDLSMFLLTAYNPDPYWLRFITMLASIPILAFGAYLTLISRVGIMAGDGFARAISNKTGLEFGRVRVISDSSMTLIAAVMSFAAFGSFVSVREGTVIAALLTGTVVGLYNKHFKKFEYAIVPTNRITDFVHEYEEHSEIPAQNFVVTIAREYGSGGREIGRAIAHKLGCAFFDSELIAATAQETGLAPEYIQGNEQKVESAALQSFYAAYAGAVADQDRPKARRLYEAERNAIREAAAKGDCVIVGRLANYALRDHAHKLSLFVLGDMNDKVAHVADRDEISPDQARDKITRIDHERAEHCLYITHTPWDDSRNYDLTVNSSRYGIKHTGEILAELAKAASKAKVEAKE